MFRSINNDNDGDYGKLKDLGLRYDLGLSYYCSRN